MNWPLAAAVALGGVPAGWLATHLAQRYQEEDDTEIAVLTDASCPHCATALTLTDTAPPKLWFRRLRCPHCEQRLPFTWLALQLLVPVLGVITVLQLGSTWALAPVLWLVGVLVVASAVDTRLMLIPKRVAWVGFAVAVPMVLVVCAANDQLGKFTNALIGSALYFGILFVLHLINPRGMGFGDVRLAATLGLFLGWIGVPMVFIGLFIACVAGLIMGIGVRIGSAGQKHFPFGPGLAVGTLAAIWFMTPIIDLLQPK